MPKKYNFVIRKDGDNYSNRYINWDNIITEAALLSRYQIKSSAYIELNNYNNTGLVEIIVNLKASSLLCDTDTTSRAQSLGFAKLIHSDATNSVYTYVLKTTDGNDIFSSMPNNMIDIEFKYFGTNTVIPAADITNYTICLEFT